MLRFACPTCNAVINSPDGKAGVKVACPKCGQRLQIPAPPKGTILAKPLPPRVPSSAGQTAPAGKQNHMADGQRPMRSATASSDPVAAAPSNVESGRRSGPTKPVRCPPVSAPSVDPPHSSETVPPQSEPAAETGNTFVYDKPRPPSKFLGRAAAIVFLLVLVVAAGWVSVLLFQRSGVAHIGSGPPPAKIAVTWLPLTEVERARWNKLRAKARREFIDPAMGIPPPSPPQLWEDDKKREEEDKKRAEVAKERAEQAKVWAEKQWETTRGHHQQYLTYSPQKKSWFSVSLPAGGGILLEVPRFDTQLPKGLRLYGGLGTGVSDVEVIDDTYQCDNDATVRRRCALLAVMPQVQCVAVIDLFSAKDPMLIAWVQDDGTGEGVRWDAQPSNELLEQLKQFVHHLQTIAN